MTKHTYRSPEARKQQRLRTLGTNNPVCPSCGETDWRTFEQHHLAGKNNDSKLIVAVCANCHRKLTDQQKDHPADVSHSADELGRIAHFMLGLAELLTLIVEKLREFADFLFNHPSRVTEKTEAQS